MSKGYVAKHNDERHVQNERAILTRLRHPFVVSLFGTFQDKKKVYFVMEFVAGGELFSKLRGNQCLTAPVARFYLAEILSALAYVHANGFAYRDLRVRPRPPFFHVGEFSPPLFTGNRRTCSWTSTATAGSSTLASRARHRAGPTASCAQTAARPRT